MWRLSGIPGLYGALAERIAEGLGREAVDRIARSTANLARGIQAGTHLLAAGDGGAPALCIDRNALQAELGRIETGSAETLQSRFDEVIENYHGRLDRSHGNFLERATASLISHLERYGDREVWTYDPTGLRMLLRTGYQVFGARAQRTCKTLFEETATEIATLYRRAFDLDDGFAIKAPPPPTIAPPVVIGQTIALDVHGNWWRSWWQRRRGYQAFAADFYRMIMAETDPIVADLKGAQVAVVRSDAAALLQGFLDEQRAILLGLADRPEGAPDVARDGRATEARLEAITGAMASLTRDAA